MQVTLPVTGVTLPVAGVTLPVTGVALPATGRIKNYSLPYSPPINP